MLVWPLIGALITALRHVPPLDPARRGPPGLLWEWLPWGVWLIMVPLVVEITERLADLHPPLRKLLAHSAAMIAVAILHSLLVLAAGALLPAEITGWQDQPVRARLISAVAFSFLTHVVIYGATVVAIEAYDHSEESRQRELDAARLEREMAEAEIRLLEAQVHPRLLLDTLRRLEEMLLSRHPGAESLVESFSRFLRVALMRMKGLSRSPADAVEFINSLLVLQRDRCDAHFEIDLPETANRGSRNTQFDLQPVMEALAESGIVWQALDRVSLARGSGSSLVLTLHTDSRSSAAFDEAFPSLKTRQGITVGSPEPGQMRIEIPPAPASLPLPPMNDLEIRHL